MHTYDTSYSVPNIRYIVATSRSSQQSIITFLPPESSIYCNDLNSVLCFDCDINTCTTDSWPSNMPQCR